MKERKERKSPDHIMFSVRINQKQVEQAKKLGFQKTFRSWADQKALTALYAEKAGKEKAFRLERTDTAGNRQADGGNIIFKKEGVENIYPFPAFTDIADYYGLSIAEVFWKQGDNGAGFLRLTFSRGIPSAPPEIELTEDQNLFVNKIIDRPFRKLYGFFNEEAVSLQGDKSPIKGSVVTLNIAGAITDANEIAERKDSFRDLRIFDDGKHFRCPLRSSLPECPTKKVA
jgi:hypothetical protein